MNFPTLQLTNAGINAILSAVYDGSAIEFTGIKIGSGNAPANVKTATDVTTAKKTVGITACTVSDGVAALTFKVDSSTISSAFYFKEVGVFATVTDSNEESTSIMFAYTNAGSEAAYVKPYEDEDFVTLEYTGYVTTEDFNAHVQDHNNPHETTAAQVGLGNVEDATPSNGHVNFTRANTLTALTSGDTLGNDMGKIDKAIATLISHIQLADNPHGATAEQVGAAPASHTHDAAHITSGTLAVARGGTGVTSYDALAGKMSATVAETLQYLGLS